MVAALLTLLADFMITGYYERKQEQLMNQSAQSLGPAEFGSGLSSGFLRDQEDGGKLHIVGMRAHADHHRHSLSMGPEGFEALANRSGVAGHGHDHGDVGLDSGVRHVVVSQVNTFLATLFFIFLVLTFELFYYILMSLKQLSSFIHAQ